MAFKLNRYLFLVAVIVGALHVQGDDKPNPRGKLLRNHTGTCCLPVNSYSFSVSLGL